MHSMENLRLLRDDLVKRKWSITSFPFSFNGEDYIVLVKRFDKNERIHPYAIVKVEFDRVSDLDDFLEKQANTMKIFVDAKTLREFFKIKYAENIGDLLQQFYKTFGKYIPTKASNPSDEERNAIEKSMQRRSDSEDPSKIYCYMARHNANRGDGTPGCRSVYNDTVTRLRRPTLYEKLSADWSISFCYSDDPTKEKSDAEIMEDLK